MNTVNQIDLEKLSIEELQNLLYERVKKEYNDIIGDLKKLPPEEIVENSYKKVICEDIVMIFEAEDSYLEREQLIALLKFKYPLHVCYDAWMDTDYTYMDMLRDTIIEHTNNLIKETKAA